MSRRWRRAARTPWEPSVNGAAVKAKWRIAWWACIWDMSPPVFNACWTVRCISPKTGRMTLRAEKNYVPEEVVFRTKPQIALGLVDRSSAAGIVVKAWAFDEFYARERAFLDG